MNQTDKCPHCGDEGIYREEADVGVGVIYGPYGCNACGWSEWTEYDSRNGPCEAEQENPDFYVSPTGGMFRKEIE